MKTYVVNLTIVFINHYHHRHHFSNPSLYLQVRSEETTSLLAEKARIAEEESGLLLRKAADLETEIFRLNLAMTEVSIFF